MFASIQSWLKQAARTGRRSLPANRPRWNRTRVQLETLESRLAPTADPINSQFLVNETLSPPESTPAVAIIDATAGAGDFLAVWQSYGPDGDGFGVFAQLFDRDGQPIVDQAAFQVNQPLSLVDGDPALGNQFNPTVASDGSGHFVIAWQSENQATGDYDIFFRQGSFAGGLLTLEDQVQVNTLYVTGQQTDPTAAMNASGDFVIAWQTQVENDPLIGLDYNIYARQGTRDAGLVGDPEFLVNTSVTTLTGDQTSPAAAMNAAGDFVIAYRGPDPEAFGAEGEVVPAVLLNLYYTDGADQLNTGEVKVNSASYHDLGVPDVAFNASGAVVVTWQVEGQPESGSDIFGRRMAFDPLGAELVSALATSSFGTDDFQLNATSQGPQRAPAVAMDDTGNFLATWQTQHQDGFSWAIYGNRYDAGTDGFGGESLINTGTQSGPQINPDVAMTGGGRTVVIWLGPDVPVGAEEGEGGHKPGVHAHLFDGAGETSVGAGEVLLTTYLAIEEVPTAAATDAAGNFVVVWQSWEDANDGSDFGIYAKLFQANGQPIDRNQNGLDDDAMLVNTTTAGAQTAPAVAMDNSGNFVVVWQSALQDGSGTGIYARRYDASNKDWADAEGFLVNVTTAGDQANPKVGMDAAGNFVVVWESTDGVNTSDGSDSTGIFGRRFAASGAALGGEFQVNAVTDYNQVSPVIAMNAAGQYVVGWVSDHGVLLNPEDTEKSIFARWYDATRASLPSPAASQDFPVAAYTKDAQEHPEVGIDARGNFVFTWQSINQEMNVEGVGNSWGVYARQFVVDGTAGTITSPQAQEFRINETTDGPQRYPAIGVDQGGNFTIAWQSIRQDASSWAVLSRQYDALGAATGPEALVNTYTSGPQILPVIAQTGSGDFGVFWAGGAPEHLEGVSGQRFHYIRDTFNRGNFPSLGPDWTVRTGNYDIHDNVAAVQTNLGMATLNNVAIADVSVEAYVTLGGGAKQSQGLIARYRGQTMYLGRLLGLNGQHSADIYRLSGGVWTRIATGPVGQGVGLLRFEVVGSSQKLFLNNQLVAFATDRTLTAPGQIGMRGIFDSTLDNFTYAPVIRAKATLPFRDPFTLSSGSQLSRHWVETAGNFTVASNRIVGSAGLNFAYLNGVSVSDVTVRAVIDVTAGGTAGLFLRHQQANSSLYQANIKKSGDAYYVEIWKTVNGVWTRLALSRVATGTGTLRFEAVGASLKAFLNDTQVASATDRALTTGTVGMRSSGTGSYDDFQASGTV